MEQTRPPSSSITAVVRPIHHRRGPPIPTLLWFLSVGLRLGSARERERRFHARGAEKLPTETQRDRNLWRRKPPGLADALRQVFSTQSRQQWRLEPSAAAADRKRWLETGQGASEQSGGSRQKRSHLFLSAPEPGIKTSGNPVVVC